MKVRYLREWLLSRPGDVADVDNSVGELLLHRGVVEVFTEPLDIVKKKRVGYHKSKPRATIKRRKRLK